VANAIYVWGIARALQGRVLLRLEDHDRGRCRPEYEVALLQDLEWLGLEPDIGKPAEFRSDISPYRQSNREAVYAAALRRLAQDAPVYPCDCSRKDVSSVSDVPDQETRYSGRCRDRELEPGEGRGMRVVFPPGVERFTDAKLGGQEQEPALQCGDLLLRDRRGNWTYQFAVTVDDWGQGVDLVIRGEDLLGSTGRQIRLARMLGRTEPPAFFHHPLISNASGVKLSKADGETGIRELRAAGIKPGAVLGLAAHLTGLLDRPRELRSDQLAELFH
jgi:glutamyl-tRNA synthetase/glutamyl-Q tRNA(Asp) synthetase